MAPKARPRLLVEERRRRILERINREETVTVDDLAKGFAVSAVTVRADLQALSDAGLLVRSHGGAVRRLDHQLDLPINVKESLHRAEKVRIAERAVQMINPEETIVLDSGSTTLEIARRLRVQGPSALTVITNALNIALELAKIPHVRTIMLGGILRQVALSLVGPHAEQALRELNADRAFIGVDGLDPDVGLSTPDVLEAQLNAMMMRVAREVVVVADASKFGRRSLSVFGRLESCRAVITDDRLSEDMRQAVRARGVELILVGSS
jgi:DeoR family transcriptional regulator, aga operon transcriptional repressor